jgi:hypothetical protein
MADEFKLHHETNRGARAEALLRNDLLAEAFATIDREYVRAWRLTHINDVNARERLFQAVQSVVKVKDHLVKVVNDGKLAQRELEELEAKRKRFGIVWPPGQE